MWLFLPINIVNVVLSLRTIETNCAGSTEIIYRTVQSNYTMNER